MLKIQSTAFPPERKENFIKEGGLYFQDKQTETLKEAKKIIKKPKDEVRNACIFFWEIVIGLACLYLVVTHLI